MATIKLRVTLLNIDCGNSSLNKETSEGKRTQRTPYSPLDPPEPVDPESKRSLDILPSSSVFESHLLHGNSNAWAAPSFTII